MPAESAVAQRVSRHLPIAMWGGLSGQSQGESRFVQVAKVNSVPKSPVEGDAQQVAKRVEQRTNNTKGAIQLGHPSVDVLTRDGKGNWNWITNTNRLQPDDSGSETAAATAEASPETLPVIASSPDVAEPVSVQQPGEQAPANGRRKGDGVRSQRFPGTRLSEFSWTGLKEIFDQHEHWVFVQATEQAVPNNQQPHQEPRGGWDPIESMDRVNPSGRLTIFQAAVTAPPEDMQKYLDRRAEKLSDQRRQLADERYAAADQMKLENEINLHSSVQADAAGGRGMLISVFGGDSLEEAQEAARAYVQGVGGIPATKLEIDDNKGQGYETAHQAFAWSVRKQLDPERTEGAPGLPAATIQAGQVEIPEHELRGIGRRDRAPSAHNQPDQLRKQAQEEPDHVYRIGEILTREDHPVGPAYESADEQMTHSFILGATGSGKTTAEILDLVGFVNSAPTKPEAPPNTAVYITRKKTAKGETSEEQIIANMLQETDKPVYVLDLTNVDHLPILGNPLNPQSALEGQFLQFMRRQAEAFASAYGLSKQAAADLTFEMYKKYVNKAFVGSPNVQSETMASRFGRNGATGEPEVAGENPSWGTPLHVRHDIIREAEKVGYTSTTETGQTSRWVGGVAEQLATGDLLHAMEGMDIDWKKVFSSGGVLVIKTGGLSYDEQKYILEQLMIRLEFELPLLEGQQVKVSMDEAGPLLTDPDFGPIVGDQATIIRQAGGALVFGTTDGEVVKQIENNAGTKKFMRTQGEHNQEGVTNMSGVGIITDEEKGQLATYEPGEALLLTPGARAPVRIMHDDIEIYKHGAPGLGRHADLADITDLLLDDTPRYPFTRKETIKLKDKLYKEKGGTAFSQLVERATIDFGLGFGEQVVATNRDLKKFWATATDEEKRWYLDKQIDVSVDSRTKYFIKLADPERAKEALQTLLVTDPEGAIDALRKIGFANPDGAEQALAILKHTDITKATEILVALGLTDPEKAAAALESLELPDQDQATTALAALGITDVDGVKDALEALRREDLDRAPSALAALGLTDTQKAVDALKTLRQADPERTKDSLLILGLKDVKRIIREKIEAALTPGAEPSAEEAYDRRGVIPGFEGVLAKAIVMDHAGNNPTPEEIALDKKNDDPEGYQLRRDEYPPDKLAKWLNGRIVRGQYTYDDLPLDLEQMLATSNADSVEALLAQVTAGLQDNQEIYVNPEGQQVLRTKRWSNPYQQANDITHDDATEFILAQDTRSDASIIERGIGSFVAALNKGKKVKEWLKKDFEPALVTAFRTNDRFGGGYILNAVNEAMQAEHAKIMNDNPARALVEGEGGSNPVVDKLNLLLEMQTAKGDTQGAAQTEVLLRALGEQSAKQMALMKQIHEGGLRGVAQIVGESLDEFGDRVADLAGQVTVVGAGTNTLLELAVGTARQQTAQTTLLQQRIDEQGAVIERSQLLLTGLAQLLVDNGLLTVGATASAGNGGTGNGATSNSAAGNSARAEEAEVTEEPAAD